MTTFYSTRSFSQLLSWEKMYFSNTLTFLSIMCGIQSTESLDSICLQNPLSYSPIILSMCVENPDKLRYKIIRMTIFYKSINRKLLFIVKCMTPPWPNLLCCTKTHFTTNYKLQNGERDVSYPQLLHLSQERLAVGTSDLSTWDFVVLLVLPCFFTMATATTV